MNIEKLNQNNNPENLEPKPDLFNWRDLEEHESEELSNLLEKYNLKPKATKIEAKPVIKTKKNPTLEEIKQELSGAFVKRERYSEPATYVNEEGALVKNIPKSKEKENKKNLWQRVFGSNKGEA